jgi:EmrB/QacA subfamily drug resistance transporter
MEETSRQEKTALIVVTTTSFLTPFMGSSINLAIPSIGQEFSSSALHLGWIVTSYLLASAALLLPLGRLADIVGRKKIYVSGIFAFAVFTFLCSWSHSINQLIVFRVFQGLSSAMIFATGMAILTAVYPPQKRGKALGITVAGTYLGLSLGPVLGGMLNHQLGWRSIFYFTFALSVYAAGLAALRLKDDHSGTNGEKFDIPGSILYTAGLVACLYGLSSASENATARYIGLLGLILIVLFVWLEAKSEYPLIKIDLFVHNSAFAFSNLAAMINYSATFAVGFLISLYLQVSAGFTSQTAGLIMLSQPVLMTLLSPLAGTLSDRVEPRIVASWGMGLTTIGLFLFIFLGASTPVILIVTNLAFLGVGFALFSSPNNNAVMGSVEPFLYGIASSTLGTMRLVGQAISMAVVTLVMASIMGNADLHASAPLLLKASRVTFMICTATCLVGILASLARGNVNKPVQQGH